MKKQMSKICPFPFFDVLTVSSIKTRIVSIRNAPFITESFFYSDGLLFQYA